MQSFDDRLHGFYVLCPMPHFLYPPYVYLFSVFSIILYIFCTFCTFCTLRTFFIFPPQALKMWGVGGGERQRGKRGRQSGENGLNRNAKKQRRRAVGGQ